MKEQFTVMDALKIGWCTFFHRHHWRRTFRKQLRTGLSYDVRCEKCGHRTIEYRWIPPI